MIILITYMLFLFIFGYFYEKSRYGLLYLSVRKHFNQSSGQSHCWQNDYDLWYEAGLITKKQYDQKYWPPLNEFRQKCEEYLCSHHQLMQKDNLL